MLSIPWLSNLLLSPPFAASHFTSLPPPILNKFRPKPIPHTFRWRSPPPTLRSRNNSANHLAQGSNFKSLPHLKNLNSLTQPSPYKGSRSKIEYTTIGDWKANQSSEPGIATRAHKNQDSGVRLTHISEQALELRQLADARIEFQ